MTGHGVSSRSSHSAAAGRTTPSAKPCTQSRTSRWSSESSREKAAGAAASGAVGAGAVSVMGGAPGSERSGSDEMMAHRWPRRTWCARVPRRGPGSGRIVPGGGPVPCVVPSRPCSPSPRCSSRRPPRSPPRGDTARYILPPGQLRRAPDHRELDRPAPALRRADAAARPRHAERHPAALPPRGLRADRRRPTRSRRAVPACGWSTTATGSRTSTARRARTSPSAPAGRTARDRGLLIQLGRGPARVAVADVPGINAFSLVTSGQSFIPSAAAEALVTKQKDLLVKTYGAKGRRDPRRRPGLRRRHQRLLRRPGQHEPAAGHGQRRPRRDGLHRLDLRRGRRRRGRQRRPAVPPAALARPGARPRRVGGRPAGRRPRGADDDQAPVQLPAADRRPGQGLGRPRRRLGQAVRPDRGRDARAQPGRPLGRPRRATVRVRATAAPPRRQASNFLVVVAGPLGHGQHARRSWARSSATTTRRSSSRWTCTAPASTPRARRCPAWRCTSSSGARRTTRGRLTSAGQDVRDVYAERLCEPGGGTPTIASRHYRYQGQCIPFGTFDAGNLGGKELTYPTSVHGQLHRDRDGRRPAVRADAQALDVRARRAEPRRAARHDRRQGLDAAAVLQGGQPVRLHLQLGLRVAPGHGVLRLGPAARAGARHLDRRLPTLGTGSYEWRGYLSEREHPHDVGGPGGLLLNWNNHSAPGFMHGDDEPYGSVQRVENFDKFPRRVTLTDDVGIMNRAATEDVRSPAWPAVSGVLHGGPAPNARDAQVLHLLDDWVRRDAPRLDAEQRRRLRRGRPDGHGPGLHAPREGGHVARLPGRPARRRSTTSAAWAA